MLTSCLHCHKLTSHDSYVSPDVDVTPSLVNYTQLPAQMYYYESGPYEFDVDLTIAQGSDYDVADNMGTGVNYAISYFFAADPPSSCEPSLVRVAPRNGRLLVSLRPSVCPSGLSPFPFSPSIQNEK